MPFPGKVEHQLLLASAAWLPCALERRRLASASVSSKAIIAILSKTRPIARMLFSLSTFSCGQCKRRGGGAEQANERAPLHLDDPKDYAEYSRSAAKAGTLLSALGQKRKNSI